MSEKKLLTAMDVREKLIERGYDIDKHANPLASIHNALKRIRTPRTRPIASLHPVIRQILRESGEDVEL